MGVFDMAQSVVAQAAGIIGSDASIDISSVMTDLEPRLMEMDLGPLFGLWFQSMFIGVTMWALYICIFIVIYSRLLMWEIVTAQRKVIRIQICLWMNLLILRNKLFRIYFLRIYTKLY